MKHLERSLDGQNQWWKYFVVFVGGFAAANLIGAIPLMVVLAVKIAQNGGISPSSDNLADLSAYGISSNLGLFLMLLPFAVGLLAVILMIKPLHKRSVKEVINGTQKIRWNKVFTGFWVWGVIMVLYFAIIYFINPDNFQFQFNISSFVVLVIISLSLLPLQTTYEELLFRGYLPQGIAAWTGNRWLVIIIPAFFFGIMHAMNPEVKEFGFWLTMPSYWIFGLFFGLITVLDDGIETAMGVHAANNIFSSLIVTHTSSVLQTPALFTQLQVKPVDETIVLTIMSIIFAFIMSKKYKWDFSILNKKVESSPN